MSERIGTGGGTRSRHTTIVMDAIWCRRCLMLRNILLGFFTSSLVFCAGCCATHDRHAWCKPKCPPPAPGVLVPPPGPGLQQAPFPVAAPPAQASFLPPGAVLTPPPGAKV